MQQIRELDPRSPIVARVLRLRARMNLPIEGSAPAFPAERERTDSSLSQQGYNEILPSSQNPSDRSHGCASQDSYLVHAWEKLSIRL